MTARSPVFRRRSRTLLMPQLHGEDAPNRQVRGMDGLRAVACLAVFGVHFQQMTGAGGRFGPFDLQRLLENGNTGVCLFFLLTGFLLSLPFWSTPSGTPMRDNWLAAYTFRRICRIAPPYFLCLAVLVVAKQYWLQPHGFTDILLHCLFLHNSTEFSLYSISSPFWALAVIVQFYVLFPLLAFGLRPMMRSIPVAIIVLAVSAALSYIVHAAVLQWAQVQAADWPIPLSVIRPNGFVLSHTLLAHLPHFLLGMLAGGGFVLLSRRQASEAPLRGLGIVFWLAGIAILLILGIPELDDFFSIPYGRYNLPYVPALVALVIVFTPHCPSASAVLALPPIAYLGAISYGVYIYHLPCLRLVASLMSKAALPAHSAWLLFGTAGMSLTIIVASCSHFFVERPILRWARRITAE